MLRKDILEFLGRVGNYKEGLLRPAIKFPYVQALVGNKGSVEKILTILDNTEHHWGVESIVLFDLNNLRPILLILLRTVIPTRLGNVYVWRSVSNVRTGRPAFSKSR